MGRKQADSRKREPAADRSADDTDDKYARRRQQRRTVALAGLLVALVLLASEMLAFTWPAPAQWAQRALLGAAPTATAAQDGLAGSLRSATGTTAMPTATAQPPEALPRHASDVTSGTPATDAIPRAPGVIVPGDWPTYLSSEGTGYNPSETILTAANASALKLHWSQQGALPISAQPTVANGIIFWGDWNGNEHATSLAGKQLWSTNLGRTWPNVLDPCGYTYNPNPGITSTASAANVNGQFTVFVGGGDGQIYALNGYTGAVIWKTRLGAYQAGFVWSSPIVYGANLYTSLASFSDCPLVQGEVLRLNAATGAILNVFKLVPNGCTGGTVWGSPILDPEQGYLYFGSGGEGSCYTSEPYTGAIIKLRASDLGLVSYWQVPLAQQGEDGDFGNTVTLFWSSSGGTNRLMVGITQKNGQYYALDRDHISNGPVWQKSVAYPVSPGTYSPSAFDGTYLYATGMGTAVGGAYCNSGAIRALDPATGAMIWGHCLPEGVTYGAVSVSPGLVVVSAGATIVVMASGTGTILFEYHDSSGAQIYAPPTISHGVIYAATHEGTLLAFGL